MGTLSSTRVLRRAGRPGVLAAELWPTVPSGICWFPQLTASGMGGAPVNSGAFVKRLLCSAMAGSLLRAPSKVFILWITSREVLVDEFQFGTQYCVSLRRHSASSGRAAATGNS